MNVMEIFLLIAGCVIFIISFLLPDKNGKDTMMTALDKGAIKEAVEKEIVETKLRFQDSLEETANYSVEKAERALERITNEKVMAVSEFSDTVLEQINSNHKETIFLYDMLNDKQREVNSTAQLVNRTLKNSSQKINQEKTDEKTELANELSNTDVQLVLSKDTVPVFEETNGNSNDRILVLYRQGMSKVQIAKELGLGVGEVKLVIDLFQGI